MAMRGEVKWKYKKVVRRRFQCDDVRKRGGYCKSKGFGSYQVLKGWVSNFDRVLGDCKIDGLVGSDVRFRGYDLGANDCEVEGLEEEGTKLEDLGGDDELADGELKGLKSNGDVDGGDLEVLKANANANAQDAELNGSERKSDVEGLDSNGDAEDLDLKDLASNGEAEDTDLKGLKSKCLVEEADFKVSESHGDAQDGFLKGLKSNGFAKESDLKVPESNGDEEDSDMRGLGSNGVAEDTDLKGSKSKSSAEEFNMEVSENNCGAKDNYLKGSTSNDFTSWSEFKYSKMEDCNVVNLESNGDSGSCNSKGFASNGAVGGCQLNSEDYKFTNDKCSGNVNYCNFESMGGNAGLKDPELDDSESNGTVKDSCLDALKSNFRAPVCSKRHKALTPWRFQSGLKRTFSTTFFLGKCSVRSVETPKSEDPDSASSVPGMYTVCTGNANERIPRSCPSTVRVSASCILSAKKDGKLTSGQSKKRRLETDAQYEGKGQKEASDNIISLREFQKIYRKLMSEKENNISEAGQSTHLDLAAFKIFKERHGTIDDSRYIGNVPGVHVGDVFHFRVELCIVGLHNPVRHSVECITQGGSCTAVSIVSYPNIGDIKSDFDVFVFCGQTVATGDQKIDGSNLALKKSMEMKTPVRVIHGFIKYQGEKYRQTKSKKISTYVYAGLYVVDRYWREKNDEHYVYKFRMRRIPGQPQIHIEEILRSPKMQTFYNVCMEDISHGLERVPISVVNSVDDDYPKAFKYITQLIYPLKHLPDPPSGCDCVNGCSDTDKCACAVKNGGELPFNHNGCILEAKPLVYECGPFCKCPPTCHNRVSQHGIKFQLQVFKTKSMGWGVRSLNFIPSGSFVCEYIGELLEDEEAQQRASDEYLFAVGNNYDDETLWAGLKKSIPSLQEGPKGDEETGFAVDASLCGNFVRFINHSCTPNLYAQNVLFDHDNKSMPHIAFFASEDIPALQELSYHYNYTMDQVYDSHGNIKKKQCYCGTDECTGWLY